MEQTTDKKIWPWFPSARQKRKDQLQRSEVDSLTGLLNRQGLELNLKKLAREWARLVQEGKRMNLAVMMFDLNNFKRANDQYGHRVGDEVLRAVAGVFNESFRPSDLIVRWGGDEFVVLALMNGQDVGRWFNDDEGNEGRLSELNRALSKKKVNETPIGSMGVSLAGGIVVKKSLGDDGLTMAIVEALVNQADEIMYECKKGMKGKQVER